MRIKARWNAKKNQKTLGDVGTVVAFNAWKIGGELLLHLENEDFQIDTMNQRLAVISETMCFLLHIVDRWAYEAIDADGRQELLGSAAKRMAELVRENSEELNDHRGAEQRFIDMLNLRMAAYAQMQMDEDNPGFAMRRALGGYIEEVAGEKDRQWIGQQVMDVEVPQTLKPLKKVLTMCMPDVFEIS